MSCDVRPMRALDCQTVLVAALLIVGCGLPPPHETAAGRSTPLESSAAASSLPVVTFLSDWTHSLSSPLVAGQPAIFRYDVDRVGACRSTNWYVGVSFRSEHARQHDAAYRATSSTSTLDLFVTVPFGPVMETWFSAQDVGWASPCRAWDSRFGANYHLPVQNPQAALHFGRDWSVRVTGSLVAGGEVALDYDLQRIPYPYCIALSQHDRYTGDIRAYYQFNDGPVQHVDLLGNPAGVPEVIDEQVGRMQVAPTLKLPLDARKLTVWFRATDENGAGCEAWDTAFGANYRFDVSP